MTSKPEQRPPVPGKPSPEAIKHLDSVRRGLMPLVYNIHAMKEKLMYNGELPDWPTIQRQVTALNTNLGSLQATINGSLSLEPTYEKDAEGEDIYWEKHTPGAAKHLYAMHPHPIPPFKVENEQMTGLANTILRKKLQPPEEDWVEQRLAKASEFADVPAEWGVDLERKPRGLGGDEEDEEDGGEDDGDRKRFKRGVSNLREDVLVEIWEKAAKIARPFEGEDDEYETGSTPGAHGNIEEKEREKEGEGDKGKEKEGEKKSEKPQPIMPLSAVHRFMMTGA